MTVVTYTYLGPDFAHGGAQPSINLGVIHDVEAPIEPGMARSLCGPNYFGHGGDPGKPVSIHYVVGPDDICQGTPENIVAWHAGNCNPGLIGIEQLGYAAWTPAVWIGQGQAQFDNLAKLMADISARHPLIPLRWLTDSEVLYALDHKTTPGGWTTHAQLSRVGRSTGHTDPGSGWPKDYVMALAQHTTDTDWFTMASQADLSAAITAAIPAIAAAVWGYMVQSANEGGGKYTAATFLSEIDKHTAENVWDHVLDGPYTAGTLLVDVDHRLGGTGV